MQEQVTRHLVAQSPLQTGISGLWRVSIRWDSERRTGEWLHVDVENLVSQLDVICAHVPRQPEPPTATTKLVLPRALSLERYVARRRQAIELEQQRRLEAATC